MRTLGVLLLCAGLLLIAAAPLRAATIHVDADKGDDRRDGTAAEPKATIAAALAVAAAQAAPVEYDYRGVTPPRQDGGFRDEPDEDDGINRNWWRAPLGSGMRGGL